MAALTLDQYLAETGELEAFTAIDENGKEVALELRHPARAEAERILNLITSDRIGIGGMRAIEHAAIEACVKGATEENITRIQRLGGDALRARLFDLIGLPKPDGISEAEAVGNSPSDTT